MRIVQLLLLAILSFTLLTNANAQEVVPTEPCDATCTDYDYPDLEISCKWYWTYNCTQCTDLSRTPTSFGILELPQYEGPAYGREYCNGQPTWKTAWRYYYCGYCPFWQ